MDFYRYASLDTVERHNPSMFFVYTISALFIFQLLLVSYVNSTYFEQFMSAEKVSLLYSLGAGLSLIFFIASPFLLRRIGNVFLTLILMGLLIASLLTIGLTSSVAWSSLAFIVFLTVSPLIYFNIDIFTETIIGDNEHKTGTTRGVLLTIMSIAALLAPLTMGLIVGTDNNLKPLYIIGASVGLVFITLVVFAFRHFYDPEYDSPSFIKIVKSLKKNHNLRTVSLAHFLLQLFFTWAILYVPLFLTKEVGFDWDQIGVILAIGLLAFAMFELPIGYLADKYFGEKEMMAIGFLILALSLGLFSYFITAGFLAWMALMFFSRIGASLVEATTESYFFKLAKGTDGNQISFFRMLRPIANLTGALIGSFCLLFLPLSYTFFVFGLIMASGIFIIKDLKDTK